MFMCSSVFCSGSVRLWLFKRRNVFNAEEGLCLGGTGRTQLQQCKAPEAVVLEGQYENSSAFVSPLHYPVRYLGLIEVLMKCSLSFFKNSQFLQKVLKLLLSLRKMNRVILQCYWFVVFAPQVCLWFLIYDYDCLESVDIMTALP